LEEARCSDKEQCSADYEAVLPDQISDLPSRRARSSAESLLSPSASLIGNRFFAVNSLSDLLGRELA
jgi:hypothetical protein